MWRHSRLRTGEAFAVLATRMASACIVIPYKASDDCWRFLGVTTAERAAQAGLKLFLLHPTTFVVLPNPALPYTAPSLLEAGLVSQTLVLVAHEWQRPRACLRPHLYSVATRRYSSDCQKSSRQPRHCERPQAQVPLLRHTYQRVACWNSRRWNCCRWCWVLVLEEWIPARARAFLNGLGTTRRYKCCPEADLNCGVSFCLAAYGSLR